MNLRIVKHPSFTVQGRTTWISGQDNQQFDDFWTLCHQDGTVNALKASAKPEVTHASVIGVSRVEKDPSNRAFDFMIAAEGAQLDGGDSYTVPACTWAVFHNQDNSVTALLDAEMECFMHWLPASPYECG